MAEGTSGNDSVKGRKCLTTLTSICLHPMGKDTKTTNWASEAEGQGLRVVSSPVPHAIVLPKLSDMQNSNRYINYLRIHLVFINYLCMCIYFGSAGPCTCWASTLMLSSRFNNCLKYVVATNSSLYPSISFLMQLYCRHQFISP